MGVLEQDCLLVGGGVAGSCLALFLSRRGLRVTLADDGRAHHSGPYETVLSGTRAVWERMGLLDLVDDGIGADPLRHGALWGGAELVWRDEDEPGLLLARGRFDRALRAAAAAAGARVLEGVSTRRLEAGAWAVGDERIAPQVVAFATGRRATVPGLPSFEPAGPRTVAVTFAGTPDRGDRLTAVVEATEHGWSWSHAPADGPASAAVMLDAAPGAFASRAAALLAGASGPAGRLMEARVVRANDASARLRPAVDGVFVVGDAAGTIDPLASQGAEKAVAAAEHAATAIATAVAVPEWTGRLSRAHACWEHELCDLHVATSADYYAQEQRFGVSSFWQARRAQARLPAARDDVLLRWRPGVAQAPALLRHGDRFVELDGLRDPGSGRELARAGRVPTAQLLDLFAAGATASQAMARAAEDPRLLTWSPRDLLDAVTVLCRTGWLLSDPQSEAATR